MRIYHLVEAESLWALSQRGSVNLPQVKELQDRLRAAGHDPGPSDGWYGQRTADAVRSYQQANNLAVDGDAGPQTLGSLGMSGAQQTPAQPTPPAETPPAPAPRQPAREPAPTTNPTRREPEPAPRREPEPEPAPRQDSEPETPNRPTSNARLGRLEDMVNDTTAINRFVQQASRNARTGDEGMFKLSGRVRYPRTDVGRYVIFPLQVNPDALRAAGSDLYARFFEHINEGQFERALDVLPATGPRPDKNSVYFQLRDSLRIGLRQLHQQFVREFELNDAYQYHYTVYDGVGDTITNFRAEIVGEDIIRLSKLAGL